MNNDDDLYNAILNLVDTEFLLHDENNEFLQGDLVFIEECRPLAKTKSWRVTKLAEKSQAA